MSEFSRLIPRIPEHMVFPTTGAALLELAREFQITVQDNQAKVLERLKSLDASGVRDGTSAYQAISLDDVAYASWLAHSHVTFDFHGSTGYADFVHEHSSRASVSLSVFEERLRKLVEAGYAISISTLKNALTNAVFSPRRSPYPSPKNIGSSSAEVRESRKSKDVVGKKAEPSKVKKRQPFVYNGKRFPELVGQKFKNKTEFIRATGTSLHITVVRMRLAEGWNMDDAVSMEEDLRGTRARKPRKSGQTKNRRPIKKVIKEAKIPVIYVATSKTTGLKFVGATRTNSPQTAWACVINNTKRHVDLYTALSKLGSKDFVIETVEVVDEGNPLGARARWIKHLGTIFPHGYNIPT